MSKRKRPTLRQSTTVSPSLLANLRCVILKTGVVPKPVRPEPFGYAQESLVEACHELVEWGERVLEPRQNKRLQATITHLPHTEDDA